MTNSLPRVVFIKHGEDPDDDRITRFFIDKGISPDIRRPFKGEPLGLCDSSVVASVVYGGPFNVFEEDKYPFLHDENRWIERCLTRRVPILAICQGAQSMARVLGASVGPKPGEPCEFGYYEIEATAVGRTLFPERLVVAMSHFHEFQLPAGATLLATSAAFRQQAFAFGDNALAFQFHAEVTPAGFRRWQKATPPGQGNYGRPGAQTPDEQTRLMRRHDEAQHVWFLAFLQRFFASTLFHFDETRRASG
jgi:GMP synthase (glutamine-hydrolysing)